jgi:hypothetical protein
VASIVPLVKAELHYTTDDGEWQARGWHTAAAELRDGKITARLPAERGITYFLTATDERGAVVPSEHESL